MDVPLWHYASVIIYGILFHPPRCPDLKINYMATLNGTPLITLGGQRLIPLVDLSDQQAHTGAFYTLAWSQPVPICWRLKMNNEDCKQMV